VLRVLPNVAQTRASDAITAREELEYEKKTPALLSGLSSSCCFGVSRNFPPTRRFGGV